MQTLLTELEMKIPSSPKLLSRRSVSRAALVGICRKKTDRAAGLQTPPGTSLWPHRGLMSTSPSLELKTGAGSK